MSWNKKSDSVFKKEVFGLVGDEYVFIDKYRNAHTKLKVLHRYCGKTFKVAPNNFLRGSRCPHCNGNHRISTDEFKNRVFICVGDEYTVIGEYVNRRTPIEIRHNRCGRSWHILPPEFLVDGVRCPKCRFSRGEDRIKDVLEDFSIEYFREHRFEHLGLKRFDFFIPSLNIAIEFDGEHHFIPVEYWGGSSAFARILESDNLKNSFCDQNGINLLRIPYWEFDNIQEIVSDFITSVRFLDDILLENKPDFS